MYKQLASETTLVQFNNFMLYTHKSIEIYQKFNYLEVGVIKYKPSMMMVITQCLKIERRILCF